MMCGWSGVFRWLKDWSGLGRGPTAGTAASSAAGPAAGSAAGSAAGPAAGSAAGPAAGSAAGSAAAAAELQTAESKSFNGRLLLLILLLLILLLLILLLLILLLTPESPTRLDAANTNPAASCKQDESSSRLIDASRRFRASIKQFNTSHLFYNCEGHQEKKKKKKLTNVKLSLKLSTQTSVFSHVKSNSDFRKYRLSIISKMEIWLQINSIISICTGCDVIWSDVVSIDLLVKLRGVSDDLLFKYEFVQSGS